MNRITLETYTAMDIQMEAVPFLVDRRVNPTIPKAPGIYVLLYGTLIQYVGKTGISLQKRLEAYKADDKFTHVWWHQIDASWTDVYELLYMRILQPPLNGRYHLRPTLVSFNGRYWIEEEMSPEVLEKYHAIRQDEVDQAILAS